MTKAELVELARERDLEGYSTLNKAELIDFLEAHNEPGQAVAADEASTEGSARYPNNRGFPYQPGCATG
jgi:uncharacterized protein YcaQ